MNKEQKQNLIKYLDLVKQIYEGLSEEEKQKLALKLEWLKKDQDKKSVSQN